MTARLIHELSPRSGQPYVMLSCLKPLDKATLQQACTRAGQGSLVFNHIECLDDKAQAILFNFIQQEQIEARLIFIADKRIEKSLQNGLFRQDLFSRIAVQKVETPTLKARSGDISELAHHFAEKYAANAGLAVCRFSDEAILALQKKEWPGNAGTFKNYIELCCIAAQNRGKELGVGDLPVLILNPASDNPSSYQGEKGIFDMDETLLTKPLREAREIFERTYLAAQIERFEGSVSETAKSIGMERSALHRKLKTLDISASDKQDRDDKETQPIQKRA